MKSSLGEAVFFVREDHHLDEQCIEKHEDSSHEDKHQEEHKKPHYDQESHEFWKQGRTFRLAEEVYHMPWQREVVS